jgi:hypothetical protein
VWPDQEFDKRLKHKLNTLTAPTGDNLINDYLSARRFVIDQIAKYITRSEPDLTDHDETHLADVMKRVCDLIGPEDEYLTPHELYLLGISILFHDVGNLHGRKEHNKKIADIYNAARNNEDRFHAERNAVLAIAGAHTGSTKSGNTDTIKSLTLLTFDGCRIRGQELSAILRLGDELAEGPHRTSAYLLNHHGYKPENIIYHRYASSVEQGIDRIDGRIAITYTLDLVLHDGILEVGNGVKLDELLKFCYARIIKLDLERRYCKYYSQLLSVFKETSAYFNFFYEGHNLDFEIEPIVISDILVPGDPTKTIEERNQDYVITSLVKALSEKCGGN